MRTTDLPSWLWLPLRDHCEWDSPFNMGDCFDEQYYNIFFALMKVLLDLTWFTTFPFLLFVAGKFGGCMANLPMAVLSIITLFPMVLMRLIWAEEYYIHGGLGNPVVFYSVRTWILLSMPNIVSWTPSAALAVSQFARIVRETIVSLRIQAYSSFDAETLFPDSSAGRVWDSDLSDSGAEAWMKKLVQEDQDRRQAQREEEERVAEEQWRLEQVRLLVKKLDDESDNAIWRAISKRRPHPIFRRRPALSRRQGTELLAEEIGLTKTQSLAQRFVVALVDKSIQTDPDDSSVHRVMKTPTSPIAKSYVSNGIQTELAESPARTKVEPSEPAPISSSPSPPSPPSTRKTTPKKPSSSTTTAADPTTTTPTRETPKVDRPLIREPAPSAVSPRQEVVEPTTSLPSPPVLGVGVVSSSHVVNEPIFPFEGELPPQAILPSPEPAGLEPLQQLPSPEQAAGSVASLDQEIPGIPEIPEELLIPPSIGCMYGREESLDQGLFQPTPQTSELPTWNPFSTPSPFPSETYQPPSLSDVPDLPAFTPDPTFDAALDALLRSPGQSGEGVEAEEFGHGDGMAIDERLPIEDVEMEEQDEGEVPVLPSSQSVDTEMEEAEVAQMTEEEQEQMIREASWDVLAALLDEDVDEFCDEPAQAAIDQFAQPRPEQQLSAPQLPLPQLPLSQVQTPQFHQPQPAEQTPIFQSPPPQQTQTVTPEYGMSEEEQKDLEMELEAAFDTEMEDATDDDDDEVTIITQRPQSPQALSATNPHKRILHIPYYEEKQTRPPIDPPKAATEEQMNQRTILMPKAQRPNQASTQEQFPMPSTQVQSTEVHPPHLLDISRLSNNSPHPTTGQQPPMLVTIVESPPPQSSDVSNTQPQPLPTQGYIQASSNKGGSPPPQTQQPTNITSSSTIPVNPYLKAMVEEEIAAAHRPIVNTNPYETHGNASEDKQRKANAPDLAKTATKEQMEKRKVLKPRIRTAGCTLTQAESSQSSDQAESSQQQQPAQAYRGYGDNAAVMDDTALNMLALANTEGIAIEGNVTSQSVNPTHGTVTQASEQATSTAAPSQKSIPTPTPIQTTSGSQHTPDSSTSTQRAPSQDSAPTPTAHKTTPTPQPTPAQPTPIQQASSQQKPPTGTLPATAGPTNTQQQQQNVAPIMMGGLMLPGGNRTITNPEAPKSVPEAPQTPTITPEQKAAFEKKKQAQIKAQQEARKNKKPSIFHQSKKPTSTGRSAPSTPRQNQGARNPSQTPSPMPQIKDSSVRAAAEAIFGTPGSNRKKEPKILANIPDHLRDQVAGRKTEDEEE